MSELVVDEPAPGVRLLRLNRPERRNALDSAQIDRLRAALADAVADPACRVVLLAGAEPTFCAGADLGDMWRLSAEEANAESARNAEGLAQLLLELHTCPKPTLALAHGAAIGAGVGLVAACDIALATRETRFRLPEVRLGLVPAVISPYLLRAVGTRAAQRFALSGEWFDAEQAARIGLVHECVADGRVLLRGLELAAAIREGGPEALAACKQLFADVGGRAPDPALARETAARLVAARASSEARARLAPRR